MAGRPIKEDKKLREAIYFEPHLLHWLKVQAHEQKRTVSTIINFMVEKEKAQST